MNKSILKFVMAIVIIIIFIYAFSASYSANNIDNIAYVTALGIDIGDTDDTIKVSFEFTDDSTFSEEGSSEESTPIIDTVTSISIDSAINLLNSYVGKQINLAHCKVIIISQELAEKGIEAEIAELINNIEVRPTTNIIITKSTATEYIENSTSSLEKVLTKYYDIFPNSSEYTGYTSNIMLGEFYESLIDEKTGTLAILGGINEENEETENISLSTIVAGETPIVGERGTENIGLAVFKGDIFLGELTAIDTLCYTLISGEVESFLLQIYNTDEISDYIDINFFQNTAPKIDIDVLEDNPTINISFKLSGSIAGTQNDDISLDEISTIASSYLKSYILEYLNKTISDFECDLNNFANYAKCKFLTTEEWENYNWPEKYLNCRFNITVDADISYNLTNSD